MSMAPDYKDSMTAGDNEISQQAADSYIVVIASHSISWRASSLGSSDSSS